MYSEYIYFLGGEWETSIERVIRKLKINRRGSGG